MNTFVSLRRLFVAVLALAGAFLWTAAQDKPAAAPAADGPQPKIVVPVREFNAGKINKGAKVEHTFVIKNTGKGTLIIEKAAPSCGCTVPTFDKEIPPGGQGSVKAVVNTEAQSFGMLSKKVTITSNDPVEKDIVLTLNFELTAAIRVLPKDNVVFTSRTGASAEEKLVLHGEEGKPFAVRAVETDSEFVDAKFEKVKSKMVEVDKNLVANQGDYILTVKLSPKTPAGFLSGRKVLVKTDSKEMPEVSIRVSARVTEPGGPNQASAPPPAPTAPPPGAHSH
jgi:hypothetical protein